jgi:hypothetical protein
LNLFTFLGDLEWLILLIKTEVDALYDNGNGGFEFGVLKGTERVNF